MSKTLIPTELHREYSLWLRDYPSSSSSFDIANKVFSKAKANKLEYLSDKYNIPLEVLNKYYSG